MPKNKKKSSNWYIALTHYLTAGFVVPLIASLLAGFVLSLGDLNLPSFIERILTLVIVALALWIAVKYSANFLNRRYLIRDKGKIVKLATIYFAVLGGVRMLFFGAVTVSAKMWGLLFYHIVHFGVLLSIFYLTSDRFLQNTKLPREELGNY